MPVSDSGELPAAVLRRRGLHPRKRLGQNFLRDRSYLSKILDALDLGPRDQVLELGAGTGVLTAALAKRAGAVTAVELDDALVEVLRQETGGAGDVRIWHGNALDFDPCAHFDGPYKLAGNIPYYVTGPILRHYLESPCPPSLLVLMVQREVAERIVAGPGDLSLLGLSVQYYARPEVVCRVPAGAFYPVPKVQSAIVKIVPRQRPVSPQERKRFFEVARAGFSGRRKQLVNALSNGLGVSRAEAVMLLEGAGIEPSSRAETLTVEAWERLADAWERHRPIRAP